MQPLAAQRLPRSSAVRMLLAGVGVAGLIGVFGLMRIGPVVGFEHLLADQLARASTPDKVDDRTVVVDIDEESLSAVGQWPWPRYRVAALIDRIAAAQPAAIGLDILFPEPDHASLLTIQQAFRRDFGVDVAFTGVPDGLLDNDGYLGYTIAKHRVVAANYLYFDHVNKTPTVVRSGISVDVAHDGMTLQHATGVLSNAESIAQQTRVTGFINNQLDDDGVLRRIPLLIEHAGVVQPNLALATVMQSLHVDRAAVERDGAGALIRVGGHRIPLDDAGFATLRFAGAAGVHRAISAVDVLNGRFDRRDFVGRIVFIGSSAVGLNDVHTTAVDPHFPGLKVQALAAGNILDDAFIRIPAWAPAASFVATLAVGVVVSCLFVFATDILWVLLGTALCAAIVLGAAMLPYAIGGLLVSPATPLLTAAVLFVAFSVARFAMEKRRAFLWLRQLHNTRQVTMESMASVAETRDPETGAHIKRTQHYVKAIAEELRRAGHHVATLTDSYIDLLFVSAPLHDIGKVGVPDHILLKPGRLTPDEWEIMKRHAEFGRRIIFSSAKHIEGDNFLILAGEIAATHHEKWDGSGYPLGLAGEAIPLSGRIMATADIYDALISRRCYKEPFSHALATSLMREARGTTFDPAVLDAFFRIERTIVAIAAQYGDDADEQVARPEPGAASIERPDDLIGTLVGA